MSEDQFFFTSFEQLRAEVVQCRRCPRLVGFRENVPPKPKFQNQAFWRKPVPGFGDPQAWLLILGLAPSPDGGNRTGRIFTGDQTGVFLMKMLYQAGFSNQPTSESIHDGLKLKGCFMTAAVKCVPPLHKPTSSECLNCSQYYQNELYLLKNLKVVLALGKVAFDAYIKHVIAQGIKVGKVSFEHGAYYDWAGVPAVYCSYHPSPQNTNTGKLTETMFIDLLKKIKSSSN
jgi:uracil-DNA glycosylase